MRWKLLAIVLLGATGCGTGTTMPPVLVGRAPDAPSEALVVRLVQAARARGYEPVVVEPHNGRFAVRARHPRLTGGTYTIAVECFGDGLVSITPLGPRVVRHQRHYALPRALREEVLELAEALGHAARGARGQPFSGT